jgi:peptide/nickel transport system permease protein
VIFFAVRRLAAGAVLLAVISALTYALLFFSGQSIARNILGDMATEEQVALKEAELGLDKPLPVRFVIWAGSALTGDLGDSWFSAQRSRTRSSAGCR